jgi:hypothetical protein
MEEIMEAVQSSTCYASHLTRAVPYIMHPFFNVAYSSSCTYLEGGNCRFLWNGGNH